MQPLTLSHRDSLRRAIAGAVACAFVAGWGAPVRADELPEPPREDWDFTVGLGAQYEPSYLGAKSYEFTAVPLLGVDYKDTFFASTQDGVGWNVINQNGWKVGPIARYVDSRDQEDRDFFHIGGPRTSALRGLGTVGGTIEVGGFAEFEKHGLDSTIEVRQGVNGHEGLVVDLSSNYTHNIQHSFYDGDPPLIFTIGPRMTIVDAMYNKSYFEVNAEQSAASGLSQYTPGGGVLSYGLNSSLTVPLSEHLATTFELNYSQLVGDAADAPLVKERGTENQVTSGIFLTYEFGFNN